MADLTLATAVRRRAGRIVVGLVEEYTGAKWGARPAREPRDARSKGMRLLTDGRLVVQVVNENAIQAVVRGDSGETYRLGWTDRTGWVCACPARGTCSHLHALQSVCIAKRSR